MLPFVFSFWLLFSFFPAYAVAAGTVSDAQLQKEYGEDLKQAPFFLRFAFYKKYNKDWKESTYPQRRNYLKEYKISAIEHQKKEKAKAKIKAAEDKERLRVKKAEEKKVKNRLRAQVLADKAEMKEETERQRDFKRAIEGQARALSQMHSKSAF